MLREFRYLCLDAGGRPVRGIVLAGRPSKARQLVNELAAKHTLSIKKILPKRNFTYIVKTASRKKLKGKQAAFSKQELAEALAKMGYNNARIQPVLFDFKRKVPYANLLMFVQLSSFLLKEKMTFDKILRMMADEETNPTLKDTLKRIESELKKGKEGAEVFSRYSDIFGRFPAYMLGLATKSGNMADVYDATSKFMERTSEYKKSLRRAFMTPLLTVVATMSAIIYYIVSIFPATANMFTKFGMPVPPMTAATLKLSDYFSANWFLMFLIIAIPIVAVVVWWRTPDGRVWRDKFIIRLPIVGPILHRSSIEIFFRVFSAVYAGSENNIETLVSSAEACNNAYIEKGVKEIAIPLMLKEGMSLVPALDAANVFNETTLSRLKTGSEVGNVLQSAQQIALFYEKETSAKMQGLIQSIQGVIGMFIAIVIILLTLVSAEVAFVSPPVPGT